MSEEGLHIKLQSTGPAVIAADEGLIHRMIANLFDNELKHLPPGCTLKIQLTRDGESAHLTLLDDGEGFAPEVHSQLFMGRVKGRNSTGHGLGLSFVDAVVRAHAGSITASNRSTGGAQIEIRLPLSLKEAANSSAAVTAGA